MKKTIIKLVFILLLSCVWTGVKADSLNLNPKHELGLRMSNLDNFQLMYKRHRKDNKYFRLKVVDINLNTNNGPVAGVNQLGVSLGFEKRKNVNERLFGVRGWDFSVSGNYYRDDFTLINLGVNYVLGLHYALKAPFTIGLEYYPGIYFLSVAEDNFLGYSNVNIQASTNQISLILLHRF